MWGIAIVLWITLAIIQGSVTTVLKLSVHNLVTLPTFALFGFRSTLASLLLGVVVFVKSRIDHQFRQSTYAALVNGQVWKMIWFMAFFQNVVPFCLFHIAETVVPASVAGIFLAGVPVSASILSSFRYCVKPEKPTTLWTPQLVCAMLLSLLGVGLAVGSDGINIASHFYNAGIGYAAAAYPCMVLGVVSFALASVGWAKAAPPIHAFASAWLMNTCGAVITWTVSLAWEFTWPPAGFLPQYANFATSFRLWQTWFAVVWMGAGSGALCAVILYWLLNNLPNGVRWATAMWAVVPVLSGIEGIAFLGEIRGDAPYQIALYSCGLASITAGLVLMMIPTFERCQSKESRRKSREIRAPLLMDPKEMRNV
eukprot:TRINITY_DN2943_c0_g1_i3.p1 TRINITY_DN2943_c0_g1~~TRINITY_DN2943_c0_g1_i3.p1  ORF type:complete len:368 (+),score=53.78 TRINITY_DN2943_c0_g1_i3:815-1918(+)